METTRREILNQVASGTLTPVEAATRLDEAERATAASPPTPEATGGSGLRGVRVSSTFGRIVVLGDAAVDQATAEGPCVARREDDIFVIEGEPLSDDDFSFNRRTGGHWWNTFREQTVTVRMNPRLELWITADAGSVSVREVLAPIHAEVQAGSLSVQGFAGPLDLAASAGSIRGEGTLREGSSRIRCEMGSVRITLAPDYDVAVSATAQMGKVKLEDSKEGGGGAWSFGQRHDAVYGAGAASLVIESQMGSVVVARSR